MSLADRTREIYDAIPIWGKAIITAGVSIGFYVYYKKATSRPRKTPYKENYEKGINYTHRSVAGQPSRFGGGKGEHFSKKGFSREKSNF